MTDRNNERDTTLGASNSDPIIVPITAINQQLAVLVRVVLAAIGGSALFKGIVGESLGDFFVSEPVVQAIVGAIITLAVAAWGWAKAKKNVLVQKRLAAKLPDTVAREG